jgi:hypothetical protein
MNKKFDFGEFKLNTQLKTHKWKDISESLVSNILKSLDKHTYNSNLYGHMDINKEKNR